MPANPTIPQKANSPTGLQNPSAWACPNWARVRSCECQPSINSTNVVWNTFAREFSEGRQSGERINLGLSFASFGQAKEEESYMPVNSNIGFIFTEACNSQDAINRAIAHELGHGAFHLWHTFSSENKYQAPQGTTTNLMDYNATSTDLYKYQWDFIHNPEFVIFRGDDEEGEGFLANNAFLINAIRQSNKRREKTLDLSLFSNMQNYMQSTELHDGDYSLTIPELDCKTADLNSININPSQIFTEILTFNGKSNVVLYYNLVNTVANPIGTEVTNERAVEFVVKPEFADGLKTYLLSPISFEALQYANELSPATIKDYRTYIATLPEDERADWYLELQKKVPYHNQRDNESIATDEDVENNSSWMKTGDSAGDIMCNLTSEAMCLEMLGVEFPCEDCASECDKYSQFEDYLECLRRSNGYGNRKDLTTHQKLSKLFGVNCLYKDINSNERTEIESILGNILEKGESVLLSVYGHLVRLQAITDEGLIVDDPYGKVYDFSKNGCTPKYYNKNVYDQRNGNGLGNNNKWTWLDLQSNKIIIRYAEIYSTNN